MYYTFSPQQLSGLLGLIAVPIGRYTSFLFYLSTEETSLSMWMQQILEKQHQFTHPWKGFLGSQQKPRLGPWQRSWKAYVFGWPAPSGTCSCVLFLYMFKCGSSRSEMEQLLCTCSGFLYLGMERFVTTISPAKIAALNMPGIVWTYMVLLSVYDPSERSVCDFQCWVSYKIIIVCSC